MQTDLVEARVATFADLWPHEKKKTWKPKVQKVIVLPWSS